MSIAWAAGLFEGEGCIKLDPRSRGVQLCLNSTDYDVISRFRTILGVENRPLEIKYKTKPHHKDAWELRVGKKSEVRRILEMFLPYFGLRRSCKALDAFDHLDGI